ncbi:uncharacterized protein LOC117646415 [Thrips palmi]|uniref:Uncharacterized protein LOC117646415 n=1 Tax=Thrips palmi TaxID=161013 RepID=A0A6P8ZNZ5_THRPL|nr:uncharacterized protein LOC117646415 [Thrips palmi]XP_034243215.1 uncharacterized protein LOC117646415 [Thrips palmi]XP_034243216.1 uncharacterized protein LOC117646415 [Thrips palmi]XP_034243217.1 uncharacterized protein LOC117646415 [Thrips palmi]
MAVLNESSFENQPVYCAFNCFVEKLKDTDWISHSSKEEIRNCLQSAKAIEKMLDTLETNGALDNFMALVPELHGLEWEQLRKASDIVLSMVLTAPGVSAPCVRTCIDEYIELCGSDRFENAVSSVLICSEIYRVLLDYIASFEGHLKQTAIELQSYVFMCLWRNESDLGKLEQTFYNWLKQDTSGQNIAVAMQVIINDDSSIASSLVLSINKLMRERKGAAVVFWKVLEELPIVARRVLEKSDDILKSALDFLKISGQWMEATSTFSWVSREKGPCKSFGFNEVVSAVKFLSEAQGQISEKTKQFLSKQRNSAGCTLWDDVDMRLDS